MKETFPIRVYTITPALAKKLGVKPGEILVTEMSISHIREEHGDQLAGIRPLDYVKYVFANYNQIHTGSNNSLLFVVYNERQSKLAAIALNFTETKWIVRTAFPVSDKTLNRRKLLYKKRD